MGAAVVARAACGVVLGDGALAVERESARDVVMAASVPAATGCRRVERAPSPGSSLAGAKSTSLAGGAGGAPSMAAVVDAGVVMGLVARTPSC